VIGHAVAFAAGDFTTRQAQTAIGVRINRAKDDARKLDNQTLESLRMRGVRAVQAGESPAAG